MTFWQTLRPTIVPTIVAAAVYALTVFISGVSSATGILSTVFVLSNLSVLSLWVLVAAMAAFLPQVRIVLSVVNAATMWFVARIGLPLSYVIVFVLLFVATEPELSGFRPILDVIAAERGSFARIGVGLSFVLCALFTDRALSALGYPGALVHEENANWARPGSRGVLALGAIIGGALALLVPLPFLGTTSSIAALGLFVLVAGLILSWRFAHRVYNGALVADLNPDSSVPTTPWALHATDVHLTAPGRARVEGGGGGRDRLAEIVNTMRQNPSSFLLLSGDVTDHGSAEEWDEAKKVLAPLCTAGSRVLVAPGNHDLSAAYDGASQFQAQLAQHVYEMPRQLEYKYGIRIMSYLKLQSELADGIRIADDQLLSQFVDDKVRLMKAEEAFLRSVGALGTVDETRLAELMDELVADGIMHPSNRDQYARILRNDGRQYISGFDEKGFEITKGYLGLSSAEKVFPMRFIDNGADAEILILNSVVIDDSLVASASGNLAEEQVNRFEKAVAGGRTKNLIVLIHHAPFRWRDEKPPRFGPDSLRWSSLAMSNASGKRFLEPLSAAVEKGRTVIFCCGHRHGGPAMATRIGQLSGVTVLEGAALADPGTSVAAIALTSGAPQLGIVPLTH